MSFPVPHPKTVDALYWSIKESPAGTLGARLVYLRSLANESARTIAVLAGLPSRSHIRLLETAARGSPSVATILAVADVYGASLDWLIAGRGSPPLAIDVVAAVDRARARRTEAA